MIKRYCDICGELLSDDDARGVINIIGSRYFGADSTNIEIHDVCMDCVGNVADIVRDYIDKESEA